MKNILCFLLVIIPFLAISQNKPQTVYMNVVRIIDGDTFEGRSGTETYRIRLNGIDAPEKKQDFGNACKQRLGDLCKGGQVKVLLLKKDFFNRWLGEVYNYKGVHINQQLVKEGLAWHFNKYSKDPVLARIQKEAQQAKAGLWQMKTVVAPWEFRKKGKRQ